MIVAITGANGFIGGHLVRRFEAAGWEARPVVRKDFADYRLQRVLDGATVVVHAAGATRAPTRAQLFESNVALTRQVAEAANVAGVKRLVLISSQAAAGPAKSRNEPVTEDTHESPFEDYGRSKLAAERVVRGSMRVPWAIIRPCSVYGPGDRDFLEMFRLARYGVALHPANRDQWISIIHADDLATGILSAATDERAVGKTFFLANDTPIQWKELFRKAAACAKRTLHVDIDLPRPLVELGAAVGDVAGRVIGRAGLISSGKTVLTKPRYWICSSERARRELGFQAATSLEQGLRDTYDWYLKHRWL
jgi:nucleoside-diphosphate-sugar epimerase